VPIQAEQDSRSANWFTTRALHTRQVADEVFDMGIRREPRFSGIESSSSLNSLPHAGIAAVAFRREGGHDPRLGIEIMPVAFDNERIYSAGSLASIE